MRRSLFFSFLPHSHPHTHDTKKETMATSTQPEALLAKAKEIHDSFNLKLEEVKTKKVDKTEEIRAKMMKEEEEFLARKRAMKEKLAAVEEQAKKDEEKVNEERKKALRVVKGDLEEAKKALKSLLDDLQEVTVLDDDEVEATKKTSATPTKIGARGKANGGSNDKHPVPNSPSSATGSRGGATTTKSAATPAAASSSTPSKAKRKRSEEDDDDDDDNDAFSFKPDATPKAQDKKAATPKTQDKKAATTATPKTQDKKTTPKRAKTTEAKNHQMASSSDVKSLDALFGKFVAERDGKFNVLAEAFERHRHAKVVPVKNLHSLEIRRVCHCKACGAEMEDSCYTGVIGSTGKRCTAHKFCESCGDYIYARFDDVCPGRFWFNCV